MKFYERFPKPVGSYTVGRTQIDFKYLASDNSERELTAFFFYPSDSSEGKPTAEYAFPELPSLREELMAKVGLVSEQIFDLDIKTWCYDDLSLSDKEKDYPVLFCVHGASAYPQEATVFCQDLASNGYIVIAIGHQGAGVYKLKDGQTINFTEKFIDGLAEYARDPILLQNVAQLIGGKLEEEKAIELSRKILLSPASVKFVEHANLQSEDIRYVADCLYKMNAGKIESIFKGRLQLETGMGVFGHSFGGTTSAIVCRDDDRFVCGISFDGGTIGCVDSDIKKPFMMLSTVMAYNMNALILETNSGKTYFIIIDNVTHHDFADFMFTIKVEAIRGTRDAMEQRNIVTTYTKAFFDRYVLKKAVEIESLVFDGVEIIKNY